MERLRWPCLWETTVGEIQEGQVRQTQFWVTTLYHPCVISMDKRHLSQYITVTWWKWRDFTDIMRVSNQLTLCFSRDYPEWAWLNQMKPLKEGLDLRPPLSSEIQSRDFLSFTVLKEGKGSGNMTCWGAMTDSFIYLKHSLSICHRSDTTIKKMNKSILLPRISQVG